jgi:hypothetical protein
MRSRYAFIGVVLLFVVGASAVVYSAPNSRSVQVQFNQTNTCFQVIMQLSAPVTPPTLADIYGKRGWVYVDLPAALSRQSQNRARTQWWHSLGTLWMV